MDRLRVVPWVFTRHWRCLLLFTALLICTPSAARAGLIVDGGDNGTFENAQNIDGIFTLSAMGTPDPNIGNKSTNTSEIYPHVTIVATGSGSFDYYKFTISNANDLAIFDIDFGDESGVNSTDVDTFIQLFDENEMELPSSPGAFSYNDDSEIAWGQSGSSTILDSYLEYSNWGPGTYVLRVSDFNENVLPVGVQYTLQVSIQNHPMGPEAVPEPSLAAMLGVGAIVGLVYGWTRRRRFALSQSHG